MSVDAMLDEIAALGRLLDDTAEALMTVAERGATLTVQQPLDAAALAAAFSDVLEFCAFQDLAGQRLQRLAAMMSGAAADDRPDAALLHGPANGNGLDQAQADALFNVG